MSCIRATVPVEEFQVDVRIPNSYSQRRWECCEFLRLCQRRLWLGLKALIIFAVLTSGWWIFIIVACCHRGPGLSLNNVSINSMTVYQNSTTTTDDREWQVRSDIIVFLSTWNRNTVARCFTTYRRLIVGVEFKGEILVEQEVDLGFALKPRRSRPVELEVHGDGYAVQTDLGSLLKVELENASAVDLTFTFNIRYLRNDRKHAWMGMSCDVVATTPPSTSSNLTASSPSSGELNPTGEIVWSRCHAR